MLHFELKKLMRARVILATVLLALVMAIYVNFRSNNSFALDETYPSYDLASPGVIFNEMIFNQAYRLDDEVRANFYEDLHASNEKTARHNKSKLQSFLAHVENKTFPEKYEVAPFLQELDYKRNQDYKNLVKKYGFHFYSQAEQKTFDYGIAESEYYHNHGILFTHGEEEILSTNYIRRIIYNSQIIFGPIFFGFLILAFCGTVCQERDKGTLYLLQLQPKGRKRILGTKLLLMLLICGIYAVAFFFFSLLICLVQGIHIDGFREIFRIYHAGPDIRYVKASVLLPLILLAFFTLSLFFSTIILLVSTISQSKEASLASLLVFFGLGYVFTENQSFLQGSWNPIYAMDHVRTLTGKARTAISITGELKLNNISYTSPTYLLLFLLAALFIFASTIILYYFNVQFHSYEKRKHFRSYSIFRFEVRKITQNRSTLIYFLGALIFVLFLHFSQVGGVEEKIRFYTQEDGLLKQRKEEVDLYNKQFHESGGDRETAQEMLKEALIQLERQENLVHSYQEKDSFLFYKTQSEISLETFDRTGQNPWIYKRDLPTIFDRLESQKLDQESIKNQITPFLRPSFYSSAYESYTSPLIAREMEEKGQYLSNSGLYTFLRMIQYQRMDILFLGLIIFMVLGGYVLEKENGQQLCLIYTQPFSRFHYHLIKVLAQETIIIAVYLLLSIFILLLGTITEGLGDPNQPIIYYQSLYENIATASRDQGNAMNSITTISITTYLALTLLAIVCQGFFLSALSSLLSLFTKSKIALVAWTGTITLGGILSSTFFSYPFFRLLNPFTYFFAGQVANNAVMIKNRIPGASYPLSLTVLIFWACLLTFCGGKMASIKEQW